MRCAPKYQCLEAAGVCPLKDVTATDMVTDISFSRHRQDMRRKSFSLAAEVS
jgi:hypothetical protein